MKSKKNPIVSMWRALSERIRRASWSSRITGAIFFLTLLFTLFAPRHSYYLCAVLLMATGVLYMGSLLLHAAIRMKTEGKGARNPFTAPLIALVAAGALGIIYMFTPFASYSYDDTNEPINLLSRDIEAAINASQDGAELFIDYGYTSIFDVANVHYNILLLDESGKVTAANTSWIGGEGQTLYPLLSPSEMTRGMSSSHRLMVLVNDQGEVKGTFWVNTNTLSSDGASTAYDSLTIVDKNEENTSAVSDKQKILQERYFPSFGNVIDKFTMQMCNTSWMVVTDPTEPYTGELANREYDTDDISFYEWQGENIERMPHISNIYTYSQEIYGFNGHQLYSTNDLIAELNALDAPQREALQNHVKWLSAALDSTNTRYARIFTSSTSDRQALLIYEESDALYPLKQQAQDRRAVRDLVLIMLYLIGILCWMLLAFWVFADAKLRGHRHPALWGLFTMIGSVIALIIYNMVRPPLRVDRSGKKQPKGACPLCGAMLKDDYIACPGCGILLRSKCRNCARALENDWNFCPYCTQQIIRELPAAESEAAVSEETEEILVTNEDGGIEA